LPSPAPSCIDEVVPFGRVMDQVIEGINVPDAVVIHVFIPDHPAEVLVNRVDRLAIAVVPGLAARHGIMVVAARLHVVNAVDRVTPFPHPTRLRAVVALGARHGVGIRNRLAGVSSRSGAPS
jgi:hypothetical protein